MKISISVLEENLADIFDLEVISTAAMPLALRYLSFYKPNARLREDTVYIVSGAADELDSFSGMSFICAGDITRRSDSNGENAFLIIKNPVSAIDVFHAAQEVFLRFEAWEDQLLEIMRTSCSLVDMVSASVPIFGNPIQITDSFWNLTARTQMELDKDNNIAGYTVKRMDVVYTPETLNIMKTQHPRDKKKKKPYFYKDSRYCVNLFVGNRFVSNAQLIPLVRPLTPGDLLLFEYFSSIVQEAVCRYAGTLSERVYTNKNIFIDILNKKPVDRKWMSQISGGGKTGSDRFLCVKIIRNGEGHALPATLICQTLERVLPGCSAFEFESSVVGFLCLADSPLNCEGNLSILDEFLKEMGIRAGLSNQFDDAANAEQYYLQASCAIDIGAQTHPEKRYYLFEDYAVLYMLKHSAGKLRAECLCPGGLIKLKEMRDTKSCDNWDTLRTYLDNNMNASATAKELFLHRSTLMQRLSRIRSILEIDINDPSKRLLIRMCMSLLENNFG